MSDNRQSAGSQLFIFARFHARGGEEDAVAAFLRDQVLAVRSDPGCLAIDAHRSVRDPRLFWIHSRWNDEVGFELHAELPRTGAPSSALNRTRSAAGSAGGISRSASQFASVSGALVIGSCLRDLRRHSDGQRGGFSHGEGEIS